MKFFCVSSESQGEGGSLPCEQTEKLSEKSPNIPNGNASENLTESSEKKKESPSIPKGNFFEKKNFV